MPRSERHGEKASEKDEKSQDKSEKGEGKYHRDPLRGVFVGLVLLTIGVIYLLRAQLPDPELWWAWVILGIGIVFLVEAGVRYSRPEWRRPIFGRIMFGIILVILGGSLVYGVEISWAVILIGIGAIMLLYYLIKATTQTP